MLRIEAGTGLPFTVKLIRDSCVAVKPLPLVPTNKRSQAVRPIVDGHVSAPTQGATVVELQEARTRAQIDQVGSRACVDRQRVQLFVEGQPVLNVPPPKTKLALSLIRLAAPNWITPAVALMLPVKFMLPDRITVLVVLFEMLRGPPTSLKSPVIRSRPEGGRNRRCHSSSQG